MFVKKLILIFKSLQKVQKVSLGVSIARWPPTRTNNFLANQIVDVKINNSYWSVFNA